MVLVFLISCFFCIFLGMGAGMVSIDRSTGDCVYVGEIC